MQPIAIDCRFADTQSGLGRYTRELVTHLLCVDTTGHYVLLVQHAQSAWLNGLSGNLTLIEAPFRHYSLSEQLKLPQLIKETGARLLFSPHFNVPWFCPVPFVVTIHDLILHRYPNQASFTKRLAYRVLIKKAIQRATRVITVSNFVSRELEDVYGQDVREKIVTIREGVNDSFCEQSDAVQRQLREKYDLKKPFFLYVGNAKEHKNVQILIDSFSAIDDQQTELILMTSGKESERLKLTSGVRIIDGVSDDDLPAFYSAARAFVTASLYEGFCLPIAEAQACGCPVIAAKTSAIPEIAGESALLVEPTVEAFVDAFKNLPEHSAPHQLSWDDAAEKTSALLDAALS